MQAQTPPPPNFYQASTKLYHEFSPYKSDTDQPIGYLWSFEEASRALFAGNRDRFVEQMATWPRDLRTHAERLAFGDADSAHDRAKP